MDSMKQKATNDFMTYATAVIKSRAIPLAEDGLKPVVRRILYTMGEMKLGPSAKPVKSAKVYGDVMGKYHPHGDASIYDALVRLSQDWKMRYPLTYIKGNNGSLNGDGPAAGRYTECRLTEAGAAMLEGLDPDVIKFVPNYDNTNQEPSMLSGIFPNLLCNGTEGIAVGVSCSLVPHNLNNVVDLLKAHIGNPALSINEAIRIIEGPDFPLGGIVTDGYKLNEIYRSGKGTITLRAKAEIDTKTNSIVFKEFPYLVDVQDRIIKAIQHMVLDEGYSDIVEYENHIGKDSCYIRIICQKKANLQKVLKDLYEQTPLEKSIKINNTVIYNGVPVTLSLLGLTNIYINHRHSCITKMAKKELLKQQHIKHIQEGLLKATTKIDDVVSCIRVSDSKAEARNKLQILLSVDSEQADAILSLQLGRLTRLDITDINNKINKANDEIKLQQEIINVREKRNDIIISDLEKLRKKFGDKRRTTIIATEPTEENDDNKIIPEYVVIDQSGGKYCSSNIDDFKKGGKYITGAPLTWTYNKGLPVYCINSDGTATEEWQSNSNYLIPYDNGKQYIVSITKNGLAKKTPITEYKRFNKVCKVKEEDQLLFVFCANAEDDIIILTEGKICKIKVSDIKESGKLTMGTKIINNIVLDAAVVKDCFATINSKGQVKRVKVEDIGRNTVSINEGCIGIKACEPNTLYWSRNKFKLIEWDKVSIKSRTCDGAKIENSEIRFS